MKYDWKAVEEFYLEGDYTERLSFKQISEVFNIPYQTVRRYAAKHDWHNKKYRAWIDKRYKTL